MNYWWVNHGQSYEKEIRDGYLWAPKHGKVFWENMKRIKKGDYVFSYVKKTIHAIGEVTSDTRLEKCPTDWSDDIGWLVNVSWTRLKFSFRTLLIWSQTESLFSNCKNSPLDKNGEGCQGYLYEINKEIFMTYCKHIQESCHTDISKFMSDIKKISKEAEPQNKNVDIVSSGFDNIPSDNKKSVKQHLHKRFRVQVKNVKKEFCMKIEMDNLSAIKQHLEEAVTYINSLLASKSNMGTAKNDKENE